MNTSMHGKYGAGDSGGFEGAQKAFLRTFNADDFPDPAGEC
jgi:hypothetical protein